MEFGSLVDTASAVFVFGGIAGLSLVMRLRPEALRLVYEVSVPLGLIGFLIGVIGMLAAESNPAQIPPAIAIAILTVVYGGIVRLFLADTETLTFATEASSPTAKALGSAVMLAMMAWAMFAVAKGSVGIYWYPQVALLLGGIAILVFLVGRALGENYQTGWAGKVMTIGALGFACGVVAGLPQLENAEALGPTIAFSFTSLLYALIAIILGLLWSPSAMCAPNGALSLGMGLATAVMAAVLAVLATLMMVLV
jgi:hypothetical protein